MTTNPLYQTNQPAALAWLAQYPHRYNIQCSTHNVDVGFGYAMKPHADTAIDCPGRPPNGGVVCPAVPDPTQITEHTEIDGYHEVTGHGPPGPNGSRPVYRGRGATHAEAIANMLARAGQP